VEGGERLKEKKLRVQKTASALIAVLLFTSMFFAFVSVQTEAHLDSADTFVWATSEPREYLDPARGYVSLEWKIIRNCYETLVAYEDENVENLVPRLATELPTIDEEGLTYRFHIRNNVYFANGDELTPEDVEYSFERVLVHDFYRGPSWILSEPLLDVTWVHEPDGTPKVDFQAIDDAIEVDGNDIVFHLARPFAPFLQILAQPPSSIVSKAWCVANYDWPGTAETWLEYYSPGWSPLLWTTMGTGPFMVDEFSPEEVTLVRNPDYWRGPARLATVEIKSIDDWETRKQMFLDGDADFCTIGREYYSELEGAEGIRVYTDMPSLAYFVLSFNFDIADSENPYIGSGQLDGDGICPDFFSDADIRKAFAYLFDYDTYITDVYDGYALKPTSPVVAGLPFHNPDQEGYTYDLAMARHHFELAWGGQVWENGFKFTIVYNSGNVRRQRQAELLREAACEASEDLQVEFQIEVEEVSFGDYQEALYSAQLPVFELGWAADYPDPHNFVTPFMIGSPWLPADPGYSNPLVDILIDEGLATLDPTEREEIYYVLQGIYHDDVPGIALVQPLERHYERTWVQGWYHNLMGVTDFYQIWKSIATVDIVPKVVNTVRGSPWITLYIELPYGIHPEEIDLSTVTMSYGGFSQPAVTDSSYAWVTDPAVYIVDNDGDGVLERLVRIDREAFIAGIDIEDPGRGRGVQIEVTIEGYLTDGTYFVAWSTITIVSRGR
jgi:peptide/nickel transport system substrate-binding protein